MLRLLEHAGGHPLVGDAVLDQQHAERRELDDRRALARRLAGRAATEPGREVERAALSRLAVQADAASERAHQPGRDCQPQPRPSVFARRRDVRLDELLEDHLLLVRWDADAGVGDLERQRDRVAGQLPPAHAQRDVALRGELHRVRQQVGQHLPQQAGVADEHVGDVRGDVARHDDRFPVQAGRQRLQQRVEAVAQMERALLARQLARLDLREVENVVDDVEQRLGRFPYGVQMVALHRRQVRVAEQLRRADHRVEGRADLVADVGQEDALGLVGPLGGVPGVAQLGRLMPQVLLRALERRDVGVASQQPDRLAALVPDREAAAADPHAAAVAVAVAHDLVVRMVGVGQVLGEVVERDVAVLGKDVGLPPLGRVRDLVVAVAEELLEAGAHPLLILPLDVPVPDAVERAGLEELEDRRIAADQLVELFLEVVLFLAHVTSPAQAGRSSPGAGTARPSRISSSRGVVSGGR